MSESPELRLEPIAALASMQAIDRLAADLEQATQTLRNALEAAQAGDPHGYLAAGLDAGFQAANLGDTVQAQLHEIVRDGIATIRSLADYDSLTAVGSLIAQPTPELTSAAQERDQAVVPVVHGVCTIDPTLVGRMMGRALVKTIKLHTYAAPLDHASALETNAQHELDVIATVIDQSPLAEADRAEQNFYAWLHMWQARDLRATTLQTAVEDFEDDLRRAEAAYQVAVLTHQPVDEITTLEQTIIELRTTLDGDPAAAVRVQELLAERETLLLTQGRRDGLGFLAYLRPDGLLVAEFADRQERAKKLKLIDQEVDRLTEQVGVRTRRDWAAAELASTTASLDRAEQRLLDAITTYHEAILVHSPIQQTYLTALKANIADRYPPGTPAYAALLELEAVLDTHDAALFTERYTVFHDLMEEDPNLRLFIDYEFQGAFKGDPRLHIETGRMNFAEFMEQSPLKAMAKDFILNMLLLGIPSLVRNSSVLNHEGISANVRGQHQVGLGMDIVGLATIVAGPLGKVLKMVHVEKNVLRLTDEAIAQLRLAGYSDEVIAAINAEIARTDAVALINVLHPLTNADRAAYLKHLRVAPHFPPPNPSLIRDAVMDKWTKKLGRSLDESELNMLDKVIAENTTLLPRFVPEGKRMPGITYGENILDQYTIAHQNALLKSMDDNSTVAVRTRPGGAHEYDTLVPPKDAGVTKPMVLYNYPDGRRIIVRDGVLETRLSDIDMADYMHQDIWVLDETVVGSGGFAERVNLALAGDTIQHGPLVRGLTMDDVLHKLGQYDPATGTYATPETIANFFNGEKVFVFRKDATFSGYVREMPLMKYLKTYNPAGRTALKNVLPPHIWDMINQ